MKLILATTHWVSTGLPFLLLTSTHAGTPGDENWDERFGPFGVDNTVLAATPSGTNLYVGGALSLVGGLSVNNIAVWNGRQWAAPVTARLPTPPPPIRAVSFAPAHSPSANKS